MCFGVASWRVDIKLSVDMAILHGVTLVFRKFRRSVVDNFHRDGRPLVTVTCTVTTVVVLDDRG